MGNPKKKHNAIGIDLGTANSAGAVALSQDNVLMVASRYGTSQYGKTFPSYVLFDLEGGVQRVGQRAKEELTINPSLVVWGAKRLAGLTFNEASKRGELSRFQYPISEAPDGSILIKTGNKDLSPVGILEIILREIRANAENSAVNEAIATQFRRAVIGVPAYYTAVRAGHIIEAARRAGFEEVDTIAEPTAAAIRYSTLMPREDAKLLVFDMGAGTLDVTLVQIKYEKGHLLIGEVAISGDEWVGGVDMDDLLTGYLVDRHKLGGIDDNPKQKSMLKEEVERAKIRLSRAPRAQLDLPTMETVELTRDELDDVLSPVLERCRQPIQVVLSDSATPASEIQHVLFVGGPSHLACVRTAVRDELERLGASQIVLEQIDAIDKEGFPVDPMECVAHGAALNASGVLEPIIKVSHTGYGTIFPLSNNLPYYQEIIKHNAFYPTEGKMMLSYGDPHRKVIHFDVVAKRRDPKTASGFRYEMLGWQPFFIQPTGQSPLINVRMQITDRKELVTELVQFETGQRVEFVGLDLLQGEEVQLQEAEKPEDTPPLTGQTEVQGYTKEHLERYIRVANEALEMVPSSSGPSLEKTANGLRAAIEASVNSGMKSPNVDSPKIADRIVEVVQSLFTAGLIDQKERERIVRDLAQIVGESFPS